MSMASTTKPERGFIVLDFGSQLTQLIARRLRELHFYSEILPFDTKLSEIADRKPYGIILSGGPNSVYETGSPHRDVGELMSVAPVLGICYGMQLMCHQLGGKTVKSDQREYGFNRVTWSKPIGGLSHEQKVWMSHGDAVESVPPGFEVVARSELGHPAAMTGPRAWGLQFHPEVVHTQHGEKILSSFAKTLCQAPDNWQGQNILTAISERLVKQVGSEDHVLVGLSGGVDSSVVASLLTRVLGAERVHCVFVNNGLLRKNEFEAVMKQYAQIGLNVHGVDATTEFLSALKDLTDPEQKRKAIGKTFIEIFERQLDVLKSARGKIKWLGQGTLYPDVIESTSVKGGPSHVIKSHHNVGGLPERMKLGLVEPVRDLFKDEVRALGRTLGLPSEMLGRHPFPGPGLAIRIIGEVNERSLQVVREADAIFIGKLREHGLYDQIWQAFCVLLPVKTVGVQGDGRTYDQVLALRAVTSSDGMTADWYPFEFSFLREVSNEITNKVRGVSRVVYDITSKPPATIEWE